MRKVYSAIVSLAAFFSFASPVLAADSAITDFTSSTLSGITIFASLAAVLFLIKGGLQYIASTGKPDTLEEAKKTIKSAILGLVIVLGSNLLITIFKGALIPPEVKKTADIVKIAAIEPIKPKEGLTLVLLDSMSGFMQSIVESATKPIVDGVVGFLTSTPRLLNNSVVYKFWLVSVGITDALFVLVVALLGLNLMSASTFGFEELEFKQILPRIGLAFLGTNISLFLADYAILLCNVLVSTVLNATGGLNHAWVMAAVNPTNVLSQSAPPITLIFLVIFVIVAIVLLFLYITRLIVLSLGAVLSPFIFLMWAIPKLSDTAEISIKTYLVSVFMVFIHVVTLQLASSFLTLPESSTSPLISIAVAIGLFITLLKIPSVMMQMIFFSSGARSIKQMGLQIMNVMSTNITSAISSRSGIPKEAIKIPRKVVRI